MLSGDYVSARRVLEGLDPDERALLAAEALLMNNLNAVLIQTSDKILEYEGRGITPGMRSLAGKLDERRLKVKKQFTLSEAEREFEELGFKLSGEELCGIIENLGFWVLDTGEVIPSGFSNMLSAWRGSAEYDSLDASYLTHALTTALLHYSDKGGEYARDKLGRMGGSAYGENALHEFSQVALSFFETDTDRRWADDAVSLGFAYPGEVGILPAFARKRTAVLFDSASPRDLIMKQLAQFRQERESKAEILRILEEIESGAYTSPEIGEALSLIGMEINNLRDKAGLSSEYMEFVFGFFDEEFTAALTEDYTEGADNSSALNRALARAHGRQEVVRVKERENLSLQAETHPFSEIGSTSLDYLRRESGWVSGTHEDTPAPGHEHKKPPVYKYWSALANGLLLSLTSAFILKESVSAFFGDSHEVAGVGMLIAAAWGLVANLIGAKILHSGSRDDINMRGAYLHVLSDALSSAGVIVAGVLILTLGWTLADPVIGLIISVLVARSAAGQIKRSLEALKRAREPHTAIAPAAEDSHHHEHHDHHDGHTHDKGCGQSEDGFEFGHVHGTGSMKALLAVLGLTSFTMVVQLIVGYLTNSVSLFADGVHTVTDVTALGMAVIAQYLTARELKRDKERDPGMRSMLANLFEGKASRANWVLRIPLFLSLYTPAHEIAHWAASRISGEKGEIKPADLITGRTEIRGPPAVRYAGVAATFLIGAAAFSLGALLLGSLPGIIAGSVYMGLSILDAAVSRITGRGDFAPFTAPEDTSAQPLIPGEVKELIEEGEFDGIRTLVFDYDGTLAENRSDMDLSLGIHRLIREVIETGREAVIVTAGDIDRIEGHLRGADGGADLISELPPGKSIWVYSLSGASVYELNSRGRSKSRERSVTFSSGYAEKIKEIYRETASEFGLDDRFFELEVLEECNVIFKFSAPQPGINMEIYRAVKLRMEKEGMGFPVFMDRDPFKGEVNGRESDNIYVSWVSSSDKGIAVENLIRDTGISIENLLYLGDDFRVSDAQVLDIPGVNALLVGDPTDSADILSFFLERFQEEEPSSRQFLSAGDIILPGTDSPGRIITEPERGISVGKVEVVTTPKEIYIESGGRLDKRSVSGSADKSLIVSGTLSDGRNWVIEPASSDDALYVKRTWQDYKFSWPEILANPAKKVYRFSTVLPDGSRRIEGLLSYDIEQDHVFIDRMENAPWNRGREKSVKGVAAKLFETVLGTSLLYGKTAVRMDARTPEGRNFFESFEAAPISETGYELVLSGVRGALEDSFILAEARRATEEEELRSRFSRKREVPGVMASLGPSSSDRDTISAMLDAGVRAFRINFSHITSTSELEKTSGLIRMVYSLAEEKGLEGRVMVMQDLQGRKVRIGTEVPGGRLSLEEGDRIILATDSRSGAPGITLTVDYERFAEETVPGEDYIIDGEHSPVRVRATAADPGDGTVELEVLTPGVVRPRAGILPGETVIRPLSAERLTEKDISDLEFGRRNGINALLIPFAESAEDIRAVRDIIGVREGEGPLLISKIESSEGLENLDEITAASDMVLIARGDLGLIYGEERVGEIQELIAEKTRLAEKPVIVATGLLTSMLESDSPSRENIEDITRAVRQSVDYLLLSDETSVGRRPLRSVEAAVWVIEEASPAAAMTPSAFTFEGRLSGVAEYADSEGLLDTLVGPASVLDLGSSAPYFARLISEKTGEGVNVYAVDSFIPAAKLLIDGSESSIAFFDSDGRLLRTDRVSYRKQRMQVTERDEIPAAQAAELEERFRQASLPGYNGKDRVEINPYREIIRGRDNLKLLESGFVIPEGERPQNIKLIFVMNTLNWYGAEEGSAHLEEISGMLSEGGYLIEGAGGASLKGKRNDLNFTVLRKIGGELIPVEFVFAPDALRGQEFSRSVSAVSRGIWSLVEERVGDIRKNPEEIAALLREEGVEVSVSDPGLLRVNLEPGSIFPSKIEPGLKEYFSEGELRYLTALYRNISGERRKALEMEGVAGLIERDIELTDPASGIRVSRGEKTSYGSGVLTLDEETLTRLGLMALSTGGGELLSDMVKVIAAYEKSRARAGVFGDIERMYLEELENAGIEEGLDALALPVFFEHILPILLSGELPAAGEISSTLDEVISSGSYASAPAYFRGAIAGRVLTIMEKFLGERRKIVDATAAGYLTPEDVIEGYSGDISGVAHLVRALNIMALPVAPLAAATGIYSGYDALRAEDILSPGIRFSWIVNISGFIMRAMGRDPGESITAGINPGRIANILYAN